MSSTKKIFIWSAIITVIIIIIAVYETRKEMQQLREAQKGSMLNKRSPMDMPIEKMVGLIRNYYRSHDLPIGWKVGKTDRKGSQSIEVAIIFSPRIGDSRHGNSANPEEINYNNACPLDDNVHHKISTTDLLVSIHDKNGLIRTIHC